MPMVVVWLSLGVSFGVKKDAFGFFRCLGIRETDSATANIAKF